jgi:transposase
VDEVSWRKGHSYLTLVSNHATGRFVLGREGKDTAALGCFFDELGGQRCEEIMVVSMDMGPPFDKSARRPGHATKAVICYDPFHVVQLSTQPSTRSAARSWQDLRQLPDQETARRFRGAAVHCSKTLPT